MTNESPAPSSICILRLSAIGDVCHAVSAVQAIQSRWPSAKITWVIGKVEAHLLSNFKGVEFVIFDKKAGIQGYKALYKTLKGRRFDILLHMQVALRASLATLCIKAKQKWGFDRQRAKEGQWLFTNRKISPQNQPHVVDGFWAFAQAIGVDDNKAPKWDMPVVQQDKDWCQQEVNAKQYIVISPAASKVERNWTTEGYAAAARYAHEQGYSVVLAGGPSKMEQQLGQQILTTSNIPAINLIGKTSLPQLLALLNSAALVIAPDSGPAHMASSVNTPVIGLYAHSNPGRTGPYNSQAHVISVYPELLKQQTGNSVEQNPWGKRVKGKDLMKLISIETVIKEIEHILNPD